MNREIKFRMWDSENKTMIDGDSLAFEEYAPISHLLTREGIMQYTGLKDKNGKEIFEGDILKTTNSNSEIWSVDYKPAAFMANQGNAYYACALNDFMKTSVVEVTGNIYEHPHLIEARSANGTTE